MDAFRNWLGAVCRLAGGLMIAAGVLLLLAQAAALAQGTPGACIYDAESQRNLCENGCSTFAPNTGCPGACDGIVGCTQCRCQLAGVPPNKQYCACR